MGRPGSGLAEAPPARARVGYTEEDVQFMRHMILHHSQALEMAALVPDRAERDEIHLLARRIQVSQREEIERMHRWLEARGEVEAGGEVVSPMAGGLPGGDHEHDASHRDHTAMPGMLTESQLTRLRQSSGEVFDRLFLELMIFHHQGAIEMVEVLFASPRGGQQSEIFDFASHVQSDQRMEIDRMLSWLGGASDPLPH
jgi:uncharacterized protein (DUF305 family)